MTLFHKFIGAIFVLMVTPNICRADFTVNSDEREFNFLTGVYDLRGNVTVQFPVQKEPMTITGDYAKVYMYQQELHAKGEIHLVWGLLDCRCDSTDVYHKESTAQLQGNVVFKTNGNVFKANTGSYNWKLKLAAFKDKVVINGKPYGDYVEYSFITNSLVKQ